MNNKTVRQLSHYLELGGVILLFIFSLGIVLPSPLPTILNIASYGILFLLIVARFKHFAYVVTRDKLLLLLVAFTVISVLWSVDEFVLDSARGMIRTTMFGAYLATRYSSREQMRLWQNFDFDMKLWPEIKESRFLDDILIDSKSVKFWQQIFQDTYDGRINTVWDYQWTFNCWLQNQLSIVPNNNLISNIGFGNNATHTKHTKGSFVKTYANMPTEQISFPLKHPPYIIRDLKSDRFMQKTFFEYGNLLTTIKAVIKKKIMKTESNN